MTHKRYVKNTLSQLHAAAAKKKSDGAMADNVSQLMNLVMKLPVIKSNGGKFKDLVRSEPRSYSIIVMSAMLLEWQQCEYELVANSYHYSQFSKRLDERVQQLRNHRVSELCA